MVRSVEERAARAGAARAGALSKEEARRFGVVHTPVGVARFMAAAADRLLRDPLGLRGGLADRRVALVDPAIGPGAFLAAALSVAGGRPSAPGRVLGLDRDASTVAVARRVVGPAARAAGWPVRLLTADTLGLAGPFDDLRPEEVLVVLGNPPWAGRSENRGAARMERLLDDFRRDGEGRPLGERKLGVLSDDYVRFFRWCAEAARGSCGGALVALVTNSSFLDGPVHRGMRARLLEWFDAIEVVDLGGSALVARAGARDENLFSVRPGAAITLAIRGPRPGGCAPRRRSVASEVRLTELVGSRADKLRALREDGGRGTLPSAELRPAPPFFVLRRALVRSGWERALALPELMPFHREGVQTNRDAAVVDRDRDALVARLHAFVRGDRRAALAPLYEARPHYDPKEARRRLEARLAFDPDAKTGLLVRPLSYRPFDVRWFAPVAPVCHRPRPDLLTAMDASTVALISVRKDRGSRPWAHFGAVTAVPDNCFLSSRSSCRTRAFPSHGPDGLSNLCRAAVERFAGRLETPPNADDILGYILAILASPSYAAANQDALRIDYPRIPLPSSQALFESVAAAGRDLLAAFVRSPHPPRGGLCLVVGHRRVTVEPDFGRALAAAGQATDPLLRTAGLL